MADVADGTANGDCTCGDVADNCLTAICSDKLGDVALNLGDGLADGPADRLSDCLCIGDSLVGLIAAAGLIAAFGDGDGDDGIKIFTTPLVKAPIACSRIFDDCSVSGTDDAILKDSVSFLGD